MSDAIQSVYIIRDRGAEVAQRKEQLERDRAAKLEEEIRQRHEKFERARKTKEQEIKDRVHQRQVIEAQKQQAVINRRKQIEQHGAQRAGEVAQKTSQTTSSRSVQVPKNYAFGSRTAREIDFGDKAKQTMRSTSQQSNREESTPNSPPNKILTVRIQNQPSPTQRGLAPNIRMVQSVSGSLSSRPIIRGLNKNNSTMNSGVSSARTAGASKSPRMASSKSSNELSPRPGTSKSRAPTTYKASAPLKTTPGALKKKVNHKKEKPPEKPLPIVRPQPLNIFGEPECIVDSNKQTDGNTLIPRNELYDGFGIQESSGSNGANVADPVKTKESRNKTTKQVLINNLNGLQLSESDAQMSFISTGNSDTSILSSSSDYHSISMCYGGNVTQALAEAYSPVTAEIGFLNPLDESATQTSMAASENDSSVVPTENVVNMIRNSGDTVRGTIFAYPRTPEMTEMGRSGVTTLMDVSFNNHRSFDVLQIDGDLGAIPLSVNGINGGSSSHSPTEGENGNQAIDRMKEINPLLSNACEVISKHEQERISRQQQLDEIMKRHRSSPAMKT